MVTWPDEVMLRSRRQPEANSCSATSTAYGAPTAQPTIPKSRPPHQSAPSWCDNRPSQRQAAYGPRRTGGAQYHRPDRGCRYREPTCPAFPLTTGLPQQALRCEDRGCAVVLITQDGWQNAEASIIHAHGQMVPERSSPMERVDRQARRNGRVARWTRMRTEWHGNSAKIVGLMTQESSRGRPRHPRYARHPAAGGQRRPARPGRAPGGEPAYQTTH